VFTLQIVYRAILIYSFVIPIHHTDPANTEWRFMWMETDAAENISIHLEDLHLQSLDAIWNTACTGILMTDSCRVLLVDSVDTIDIIACFIVFLEITILT